ESAVRVDHDLAPGQAGVGDGTADDKASGGVDVRAGTVLAQVGRDHRVDDQLGDVRTQLIHVDLVVVLRGDDDVVDARGPAVVVVAHCDLRLPVWPQVAQGLGAPNLGETSRQPVGEHDGQRHQLGRLVAREAEHHARVSGAADVDALRDVGRLLVDAA